MVSGCLSPRILVVRPSRRGVYRERVSSIHPSSRLSRVKTSTTQRLQRRLRCAEVSGTPLVEKLNAEQLEVAIQDRSLPIVIDFYATWCGPCVLMASELLKVAERLKDKVRILKVDTDENPDLSTQLKIEGLPTLIFLGPPPANKSLRLEGMIPAEDVIKIIEKELRG